MTRIRRAECDICGGRGWVRLPILLKVCVSDFPAGYLSDIRPMTKEFGCPQCSGDVELEKVAVMEAKRFVPSRSWGMPLDVVLKAHALKDAAVSIAMQLVKNDYLTARIGRFDEHLLGYTITAQLGVVTPGYVASLQERIDSQQWARADELARTAKANISRYGDGDGSWLYKAQALDSVRDALDGIKRRAG